MRHSHGLARGHIGAICDAIEAAGIDTARYTGRDIARALTRDTQDRGWNWPSRIVRPAGYLLTRLRRIDWTVASHSERATRSANAARLVRAEVESSRRPPTASAEHRARCMEIVRERLAVGQERRVAVEADRSTRAITSGGRKD